MKRAPTSSTQATHQCSTHNGRKYFTAHSCHWDVDTAFLYLVNQSKKQPCYTSRQWPKWCILQHRTVWAICYFMDFNVDFRVCFAQPPHPLPKHPHKYRLLQIKSPRLGRLELKQSLVSMLDIPQGFGDCHRHTVKSKFNHKGYFCQPLWGEAQWVHIQSYIPALRMSCFPPRQGRRRTLADRSLPAMGVGRLLMALLRYKYKYTQTNTHIQTGQRWVGCWWTRWKISLDGDSFVNFSGSRRSSITGTCQLRETHEKNNKWQTWASAGVEDENNERKSKEEKEAGANDGRKNVHSDRTWFTIEV